MLPGVAAMALGAPFLVTILNCKSGNLAAYIKKDFLIAIIMVFCTLILWPYLSAISSGAGDKIELLNWKFLIRNSANCIIVLGPALIVTLANIKHIRSSVKKEPLCILVASMAATLSGYLIFHWPGSGEYKSLILSAAMLGILAGIAFRFMQRWAEKLILTGLIVILVLPTFLNSVVKLSRLQKVPVTYTEKGKFIYSKDPQENQMYEWIRKRTPADSVFIDTDATLGTFAQRQLFIGMDRTIDGKRIETLGYGMLTETILKSWSRAYPSDLVNKRSRIVGDIYDVKKEKFAAETARLFNSKTPVYVIVRIKALEAKFDSAGLEKVFKSNGGKFSIYKSSY